MRASVRTLLKIVTTSEEISFWFVIWELDLLPKADCNKKRKERHVQIFCTKLKSNRIALIPTIINKNQMAYVI